MKREDIIRMAREVGAGEPESLYGRTDYVVMTKHELERFARLVDNAARESCAKLCEDNATPRNDAYQASYILKNCADDIRAGIES